MIWKHDAVNVRRYGAQDLANIHRRAVGWKQRLVRVDVHETRDAFAFAFAFRV